MRTILSNYVTIDYIYSDSNFDDKLIISNKFFKIELHNIKNNIDFIKKVKNITTSDRKNEINIIYDNQLEFIFSTHEINIKKKYLEQDTSFITISIQTNSDDKRRIKNIFDEILFFLEDKEGYIIYKLKTIMVD